MLFQGFLGTLVISVFLWAPVEIAACQCGFGKSIEEELKSASVTFVGEVTKIDVLNTHFRVERVLNGEKVDEIILRPESATNCDFNFKSGEKYLVFAYGSPDHLKTSKCTSTTEWNKVKYFESLSDSKPTINKYHVGIISLLAFVAIFLISGLFFKKRKDSI